MVITDWKTDYNQRRRHSSLGYQAPVTRLPSPSGLRCSLHPPMNDSHNEWITSRGPATARPTTGAAVKSHSVD